MCDLESQTGSDTVVWLPNIIETILQIFLRNDLAPSKILTAENHIVEADGLNLPAFLFGIVVKRELMARQAIVLNW